MINYNDPDKSCVWDGAGRVPKPHRKHNDLPVYITQQFLTCQEFLTAQDLKNVIFISIFCPFG